MVTKRKEAREASVMVCFFPPLSHALCCLYVSHPNSSPCVQEKKPFRKQKNAVKSQGLRGQGGQIVYGLYFLCHFFYIVFLKLHHSPQSPSFAPQPFSLPGCCEATMKAARAPRPIKESTFLDDPSLYPEYADLVTRLPTLHALRRGFHVHR